MIHYLQAKVQSTDSDSTEMGFDMEGDGERQMTQSSSTKPKCLNYMTTANSHHRAVDCSGMKIFIGIASKMNYFFHFCYEKIRLFSQLSKITVSFKELS